MDSCIKNVARTTAKDCDTSKIVWDDVKEDETEDGDEVDKDDEGSDDEVDSD